MQNDKLKSKATTLVEVLIATVIFMIISIGSIYFFVAGGKGGTKAKSLEFALELAESGMEEIKTWGYQFAAGSGPEQFNKYGITFTRDCYKRLDTGDYRVYCASVTWIDKDSKPEEITLFTIIAPDE